MTRFDVHRNLGASRDAIPYVVVMQSAVFDGYKRRVVVPLVKKAYIEAISICVLVHTCASTANVVKPCIFISSFLAERFKRC